MPLDASRPALQHIGSYEVLAKIAEGGMGAVYKGRHRDTGEIVAIKVLPGNTARNPVLLKRFEQEFRAASLLNHPNVVRAIDYSNTGPQPFLVMEFVDGESLGQRLDREGALPEDVAVRILAQVCQGLHKAHKANLIHRDVKPDNILITSEGVAKLTDLGLVKDNENEMNLTRTGRGLGTPNFMAPEQFRNAKNADIRCDIYSLGATLYMAVTGEVPFGKVGPLDCWMKKIRNEFTPPSELNRNVSERIDWAIRRAMSGDPDKRPASCREFIEDLTGTNLKPAGALVGGEPPADVWYLVYKDDDGDTHTVKGSTDGIRRALKEGLLGEADNIRASRTKQGTFSTLNTHPEFRDLVIAPAPMAPPASGGSGPAPQPALKSQSERPTPVGTGEQPPWNHATTPSPVQRDDLARSAKGKKGLPTAPADRANPHKPHIRMPDKVSPPAAPKGGGAGLLMWLLVLAVALGRRWRPCSCSRSSSSRAGVPLRRARQPWSATPSRVACAAGRSSRANSPSTTAGRGRRGALWTTSP